MMAFDTVRVCARVPVCVRVCVFQTEREGKHV